MASLSLCSSLTVATRPSHREIPILCFSKQSLSFPSLTPSLSSSPHSLTSSPRGPTFSFVPKLSETESPVVEAEEGLPEPQPKREEVFAVVMIGSRQYIVFPGRFIYTQRLKGANVNDKVILNKVLLVGTKTSTYIGYPIVANAAVQAVVEEQGLNDKVIVFKYKKKKNYKRTIGHRQPNTRLRIISITGYENSPAVTLP